MDMEEKKIDGEVIFDGHVVKLHLDKVKCPNGNIASAMCSAGSSSSAWWCDRTGI